MWSPCVQILESKRSRATNFLRKLYCKKFKKFKNIKIYFKKGKKRQKEKTPQPGPKQPLIAQTNLSPQSYNS